MICKCSNFLLKKEPVRGGKHNTHHKSFFVCILVFGCLYWVALFQRDVTRLSSLGSVVLIAVLSDGVLELFDALCHAYDLLLKCCLLSLQISQLLVQTH